MAYINLQPSNSLSERFVLGGHFNLKMQGLGMTDMSDFSPRQDPVTSLRKYTSYQISVTPYNKQGTGPASSSVVASTMEDGKANFSLCIKFTLYRKVKYIFRCKVKIS